jgi:hypothetical protein
MLIPIGLIRYGFQYFVDLSPDILKDIIKKDPMAPEELDELLIDASSKIGTQIELLLVPRQSANQSWRVKVISLDVFNKLQSQSYQQSGLWKRYEFVSTHTHKFLLGRESYDLFKTPGVLVSTWGYNMGSIPRVTYEFASTLVNAFGVGFGNRHCSSCFGHNCYHGCRMSNRPHPTPCVDILEISKQQYYRERQAQHSLIIPKLQSIVRRLGYGAAATANKLNKAFKHIEGSREISKTVISTCGMFPAQSNRDRCIVGFANEQHIDKKEEVQDQKRKEILLSHGNKQTVQYNCRFFDFPNFCLPTTCGYQFLVRDGCENIFPSQFFSMGGLGIAIIIENGLVHNFLGRVFSHQSCVPLRHDAEGNVCLNNHRDDVCIFAWGNSPKAEPEKTPSPPRRQPSRKVKKQDVLVKSGNEIYSINLHL